MHNISSLEFGMLHKPICLFEKTKNLYFISIAIESNRELDEEVSLRKSKGQKTIGIKMTKR